MPGVVQRNLFVGDDLFRNFCFLFGQVGRLPPLFPSPAFLSAKKSCLGLRVSTHAEIVRHDGVLHGLALLLEVSRRNQSREGCLVLSLAFSLPPEIKIDLNSLFLNNNRWSQLRTERRQKCE